MAARKNNSNKRNGSYKDGGSKNYKGGRPSSRGGRGDRNSRGPKRDSRPARGPRRDNRSSDNRGINRAPREDYAPRHDRVTNTDNLCWGRNPVMTLLESKPSLCRGITLQIGAQNEFLDSITAICADNNIDVEFADRTDLDRISGGAVHQGVIARISTIEPADLDDIVDALDPAAPALIVLLDHCQDPHNLGAIIRSAEVAGAACVVCQKDRSATVNGTVVKTSAGAAFRLPVAEIVNVNRELERLKTKGFWVVGLDHHTEETVWSTPLPERLVLVVGSEGDGISNLTLKNCDKLVKFPMAGKTGNLNASIAAALGMFEWVRLYK